MITVNPADAAFEVSQRQAYGTRFHQDEDFHSFMTPVRIVLALYILNQITMLVYGSDASNTQRDLARKTLNGNVCVIIQTSSSQPSQIESSNRNPISSDTEFNSVIVSTTRRIKGLFYQHLATKSIEDLRPLLDTNSIQIILRPEEGNVSTFRVELPANNANRQ